MDVTEPRKGPIVEGPMTDEMAWAEIFSVVTTVMEDQGVEIPERAKNLGTYEFLQLVHLSHLQLSWPRKFDEPSWQVEV